MRMVTPPFTSRAVAGVVVLTPKFPLESVEPPMLFEVVDAFDNEPVDEKYIVLVPPAPK